LSIYLEQGYLPRLTYQLPKVMLFFVPYSGFFYWATFAAIAYLLIVKEKKAYFPIVWLSVLYLTFNFSTTSLSHYIPIPPVARYSFMLVLPANLILACALWRLALWPGSHKWAWIIGYSSLAFLLISSIIFISREYGRGSFTERPMAAYFHGEPDKPVYTDTRTVQVLRYFFKYENTDMLRSYDAVEWEGLSDSYVAVNYPRMKFLNKYYGRRFHPILFNPPPSWRLVTVMSPSLGDDGKPVFNGRAAVIYSVERK
jgi:hypothetical protein